MRERTGHSLLCTKTMNFVRHKGAPARPQTIVEAPPLAGTRKLLFADRYPLISYWQTLSSGPVQKSELDLRSGYNSGLADTGHCLGKHVTGGQVTVLSSLQTLSEYNILRGKYYPKPHGSLQDVLICLVSAGCCDSDTLDLGKVWSKEVLFSSVCLLGSFISNLHFRAQNFGSFLFVMLFQFVGVLYIFCCNVVVDSIIILVLFIALLVTISAPKTPKHILCMC